MNEPKQPRRLNTSAANHSGSAPRPAAPAGQRKINRSGAAPQRPAQSAAPGQRTAPRGTYRAPAAAGHAAQGGSHAAPRRKKKNHTLRNVLVSLLCLFAVVAVGLFGLYRWVVNSISPEGGAPTINQLINTPNEFKGDVVNILVCGIDYEEGRAYSNDASSNDGMTDMIMYVSFDVKNKKMNMLQIPRDVYVGTDYNTGGTGKINAVALKNNGMESLTQLIYDQYKLPVDYYVTIDMQSLKEIVDLFGGIEVYIPQTIEYNGSKLEQGLRNLDGASAEFFVRNRKSYAQGDIARLDMQRYFYQGLFKRIRTATVWDLAKLEPVALNYVTTDIPIDELISIGVSFLKVDSADIMLCKVPTFGAAQKYNDQYSILVCDVGKTTTLLNDYFRTYGGPVESLDVPTLTTVGASTDPNVQYMGQLDTQTEGGQPEG